MNTNIEWPDIVLPPINLWNFPKTYKDQKADISMINFNAKAIKEAGNIEKTITMEVISVKLEIMKKVFCGANSLVITSNNIATNAIIQYLQQRGFLVTYDENTHKLLIEW